MDEKTRDRLEAHGWQISTVAEFLGLTKEEEKEIEKIIELQKPIDQE